MRKSKETELIRLVLGIVVLLVLAAGSIIKVLSEIEIPATKKVKQNAITINIDYNINEIITLNDEQQVNQLIESREKEIFSKEILDEVEYKYLNTEILSNMKIYTFNQYYKDTLVKDSNICVSIDNDGLIHIYGKYIEPFDFDVQPAISEGTAYEIVIDSLKNEFETLPEISKLGKRIIAIKDKYIIIGYEFEYLDSTMTIDAMTGEIIK